MKIAIIGANGFIGSRLVEMIHLGGQHTAIPIVRQPSSLALPARFSLDWRLGDALNADSLAAALANCDAAIHCAIGDPLQIERMPALLNAAAAQAGLRRVVYLSSASVHGQNIPDGTTEASSLHTSHNIEYNNAKVRAEQSFFATAKTHALEAYALRPGVVYGPRSRWIADLATELRTGRAWLHADGSAVCNSIYVDNLAHAALLCATATTGAGEPYLVADAETVTWRDFYHTVATALSVDPATIHRVDTLPTFPKTFRQKVEDTVAQPWAQKLLPAIPFKLKRATKTLLASWNPPPSGDAWALPSAPTPNISEEMAELQKNRWKFPHTKAEKTLGYAPPVTFPEAMRRSLAWLQFATADGGEFVVRS